ncbi:hypothetical protein PCANC_18915 [Puccinia coronata f. sp. avenae]|uniref:Retrovirus-related Pol polyprotein from transposon TNT 1-94-like beta-barrel domain-containing protein n=1 Tax=Puccinia coronata f. sp. avenae TaxID=200324 RepID=A0A2N5U386_9BASI|nr:hypothetical protein PCANC_18915 [Puccinia coronata f. sp. avenae]
MTQCELKEMMEHRMEGGLPEGLNEVLNLGFGALFQSLTRITLVPFLCLRFASLRIVVCSLVNSDHHLVKPKGSPLSVSSSAHCTISTRSSLRLYLSLPTPPKPDRSFESRKTKASGILQQYMGMTNYQKFESDETRDEPRAMWLKLEGHYQSKAIANQAKVYNDFLALKFKGTDMDQFISDLTGHISNLNAVGLKIGIPKDFQLHENLFCESILDKIPSSLIHTREVLIQNRPLTVDSLTKLLENRSRDDTTIRIKSEESAMKAISQSSVKCDNGRHNPLVTSHLKENCFELYPEQKARMEKRRAKSRAKGKAKKTSATKDDSISADAWHACVMKVAQSKELGPHTAYLDSCATHHMIANRSAFSTYSTDSTCKIELADGKSTTSPGKGLVYVKTLSGETLKLECLHVPDLVGNLISLG